MRPGAQSHSASRSLILPPSAYGMGQWLPATSPQQGHAVPPPGMGALQKRLQPPSPQRERAPLQQWAPAAAAIRPAQLRGPIKAPGLPLSARQEAPAASPALGAARSARQLAPAWTQLVYREPEPTAQLRLLQPAPQQMPPAGGTSYARQVAAYRQKVASSAVATAVLPAATQPQAASAAGTDPPLVVAEALQLGCTVDSPSDSGAAVHAPAVEHSPAAERTNLHAAERGARAPSIAPSIAAAHGCQVAQTDQRAPSPAPAVPPICSAADDASAPSEGDAAALGCRVVGHAARVPGTPNQGDCQRMRAIRAAAHSIAGSAAALRDAEQASGQLLATLGLAAAFPAEQALACGAGRSNGLSTWPLDVQVAAALNGLHGHLDVLM